MAIQEQFLHFLVVNDATAHCAHVVSFVESIMTLFIARQIKAIPLPINAETEAVTTQQTIEAVQYTKTAKVGIIPD